MDVSLAHTLNNTAISCGGITNISNDASNVPLLNQHNNDTSINIIMIARAVCVCGGGGGGGEGGNNWTPCHLQ